MNQIRVLHMTQMPTETPPPRKPANRSILRTLQVGIPVVALVAVAAVLIGERRHQNEQAALPDGCATRTSAAIGGPLDLIDQDGRRFTEANLKGRPSLIYFGFTYCPDVCPTALQSMDRALQEAGPAGQRIQPVLISVDPERDTPESLKAYVATDVFPDGLIGLTGTPEQVKAAAQSWKVGYQKVENTGSAAGYLVDHSSIMYLMDSQGKLATFFTDSSRPSDIARCIVALDAQGL
jgi:protein SCO1/2